jgi:hypothetical protein
MMIVLLHLFSHLLALDELDLGYRVVTARW